LEKIRNTIVTGATAGIGLAVAREFLDRGHNVYICGRQPERLDAALKELSIEFDKDKIAGSV
jgi:short-subunit dehydrogenase